MSMFSIFDISASAMSAQAQRMNVTASNLANADSVAGPDGEAYRAKQVWLKPSSRGALRSVVCVSPASWMTLRRCAWNIALSTRLRMMMAT